MNPGWARQVLVSEAGTRGSGPAWAWAIRRVSRVHRRRSWNGASTGQSGGLGGKLGSWPRGSPDFWVFFWTFGIFLESAGDMSGEREWGCYWIHGHQHGLVWKARLRQSGGNRCQSESIHSWWCDMMWYRGIMVLYKSSLLSKMVCRKIVGRLQQPMGASLVRNRTWPQFWVPTFLDRLQVEGVKMQTFGEQIGKKRHVIVSWDWNFPIIFEDQRVADNFPTKTIRGSDEGNPELELLHLIEEAMDNNGFL